MDRCPNCGRENPIAEANFCYYCGTSFRETPVEVTSQNALHLEESTQQTVTSTGKSFSTGRWLLCFVLLLIPVYGWFAFAIIMAISAFSPNSSKEQRAVSRAIFIFCIVFFVVMIASFFYLMQDPTYQEQFRQLWNSYGTTTGQ